MRPREEINIHYWKSTKYVFTLLLRIILTFLAAEPQNQFLCLWTSSPYPVTQVVVWIQQTLNTHALITRIKGKDETVAEILYLIIIVVIIATLYVQSRLKALTFHTATHSQKADQYLFFQVCRVYSWGTSRWKRHPASVRLRTWKSHPSVHYVRITKWPWPVERIH